MKIIFSSIKNNDIFETDFAHLSSQNGTIEFKHMQGSGGIAVIYAPNGTGKTSLANLLDVEVSTEKNSFVASDDQGNTITPETMAFHVIQDQLNRNVIRGKTTDYLIGAQIRREYELRDQINAAFRNAYEQLSSKYKAEFKVSKVGDYLLTQIESVQDTTHQTAFQYIRSIVNTRQHGKDIDRNTFVAFIRNDENRPNLSEMDTTKRSFIITDLSKSKVVEKILAIKPDEIIADTSSVLVERHDDAIGILKKYHSLESCIVCDNHSFDGDALLESKKESRKRIYDNLDRKTKDILDKIVCDNSLISADPFEIKRIVGTFIADGYFTELINLQQELKTYVDNLGSEMINILLHCFDGTDFFRNFDEHAQLVEMQPQLDSEELLFIENVISENIGKDITIVRDEDNDKNYKLKIGDKDLLGTDRKDMELSTGEQNFISLDMLEENWGGKYPSSITSWRNNWPQLSTYFKYPGEIRKLIYTTNSIENFNRQLRKVTKSKTIFPTDDSLFKILYLAMTDITKKWTGKTWDWGQTLDQLCIYFGDRIQPEDLE